MALLKRKLGSATLMEVVVATALIVVIFVVASLVLNNLLKSYYLGRTHQATYRINQLHYQLSNGTIVVPYHERYGDWDIEIKKESARGETCVAFRAENQESGKTVRRAYIIYEKE